MPHRPAAATVVVTGASGWLGQNLVRALAAERERVRCLVPRDDQASPLALIAPVVEVVVGDVRDPATADRLFDGVGAEAAVFHAAAVIHPTRSTREFFDVNVGGTQNALDRARRSGAARFVHVSPTRRSASTPRPTRCSPRTPRTTPIWATACPSTRPSSCPAGARPGRRAHGHGAGAVVLRPLPAAPPEPVLPHHPPAGSRWWATARSAARWPTPTTWSRACCGPRWPTRRPANVLGGGRPPYELREILATVRRALEAEGLPTSGPETLRLPWAAARLAEQLDRLAQARGRYLQPLHVLGELNHTIACDVSRARAELGYEPTVELKRACGPASAGASTTGSSSDGPDRPSPGAAATSARSWPSAPWPRVTGSASSTSTRRCPWPSADRQEYVAGDVRDLSALRPPTASTWCSTTWPRCRWPRTATCSGR